MTPSEEPNDDDISDLVTTVPTIRNFREAVTSLEDVAAFLDYHGHTKEANNTRFSVNHIYSYVHYIFIDFSENL